MDPKIWAGAIVALLAGVGSFVGSANWPIALLLMSQTASLVIIYLWVKADRDEKRQCEKKLRQMKWALLRLYHAAITQSGGKRRPLPTPQELFSETNPPTDDTGLDW